MKRRVYLISQNQENINKMDEDILLTKIFADVENQEKNYQTLFKDKDAKEEMIDVLKEMFNFYIKNDIVKDFLIRHRKEVINFLIFIFNEEQLKVVEKKEIFEEGLGQGIEQGLTRGLERGLERGLTRGKMEERLNIAKKMKKEDFSIEIITKLTKLKREEVEAL